MKLSDLNRIYLKEVVILFFFAICVFEQLNAQSKDIGFFYGRFWSPYKGEDRGTGFRNNSKFNWNFLPSVSLNKTINKKLSIEYSVMFTLYKQYYATRKYIAAFGSTYGAGHLVGRIGYSFIQSDKTEMRIKGGIGIGIAPDMFKAPYTEVLVFPVFDSISRGIIKRNFTPIFPMISTGVDFSYLISKRIKLSIAGNFQKGFIRITEYDIYYNDGSGNNDQRAKQWGTGDFYSLQIGLRYLLNDKKRRE